MDSFLPQKARQRRRASLMAGMEIILAGLALPLLYVAAKVMMFNEPTTLGLVIIAACSVACIGLGIWVSYGTVGRKTR